MLVATEKRSVIYPVVIVEVEGIKCRALLDTGAGSSYASAALLDRLHKRAVRKENFQKNRDDDASYEQRNRGP